jgi:hypothetical protein
MKPPARPPQQSRRQPFKQPPQKLVQRQPQLQPQPQPQNARNLTAAGPIPLFRAKVLKEIPVFQERKPELEKNKIIGNISEDSLVLILERNQSGEQIWLKVSFVDQTSCLQKEGWIKYDKDELKPMEPVKTG